MSKPDKLNLINTTECIPSYFLVLWPHEHRYALFGVFGMKDFNRLYKVVTDYEKNLDTSDELIMEITRTQFLGAISEDRIQNVEFYGEDVKMGFAVHGLGPDDIKRKKEKAAKPLPPSTHKLSEANIPKPPSPPPTRRFTEADQQIDA